MMHNIIRLTVSVNQSDTLDASIKCNKAFINSSNIITNSSDAFTKHVCVLNNVTCKTYNFRKNGAPFNRGSAYNHFQSLLHMDAAMQGKHLLLLDADICIPKTLWARVLDNLPENTSLLSVLDRCILDEPADFSRKNRYKIEAPTRLKGYITNAWIFSNVQNESFQPSLSKTFSDRSGK